MLPRRRPGRLLPRRFLAVHGYGAGAPTLRRFVVFRPSALENLGHRTRDVIMDDLSFYRGRRVFITGHTGFKGSWLTLWLLRRGAIVSGFSLDVPTTPSLFETLDLAADIQHFTGDVRDANY